VQLTSFMPPALLYGCIQKYTSEGTLIKEWIVLWGMMTNEIATDSERNVYVPCMFLGPLQKFTPDGELINEWNTCSIDEGLCSSSGIALDSEGNVYISDSVRHCVKKYTSDGELITRWELQSSGGFSSPPSPQGLALDDQGYVYVIDGANCYIQKYKKVSDITTTTTTISCPSEALLQGNPHALQLLRDFRDVVLASTPKGNEYIDTYYQHAPEVASLLLSDERLRTKAITLLADLLPTIETILVDEKAVLSKTLVLDIESLLDALATKASPALKAEISKVQRDIRGGEIFRQLGMEAKRFDPQLR